MEVNNIRGPRCHDHGITGYGDPTSGVFLLGISPGREETKAGRPMIGASGRLIDGILKACGWSRDKVYTTNIVCYETRGEPSFEEIMQCRTRLVEEVREHKPKLVVLLGETVGSLFFPNRKYGNVRGCIDYYEPWSCYVLPTYHPAAILYGTGELVTRSIVRDFQKIARFFSAPPDPNVEFEIVKPDGLWRAQDILDTWAAMKPQPEFISLDVETFIDKEADDSVPIDNVVAMFSVSDGTHTYWIPGEFLKKLRFPKLNYTFHHGIFDTIAVQADTGTLLDITHDTLLMSYVLDERGGIHKLKSLAREELACGFYEEHPTAKKWNDKLRDTEWARIYNTKDTAYTARVAARLLPRLEAEGLRRVYDMLIQAANVYRHMQATGIPMDTGRIHTLLKEYVPLRDTKEAELREIIAGYGGDPDINLNSPKQLGEFLYGRLRLPGGPSTAAPILEALAEADEHPFIGKLIDKRHLDKAIDTYIVGAWDDIKKSGSIHPSPLLHGQVTGRISYSPYAVNTLPRETSDNPYLSRIRWLFTAPEGFVVLLIDYRQAEIWNAQFYSQDPQMLADLQSGDFHLATAAFIHNISQAQVKKEQRSDAKRTTFGQFFGIGSGKLAKQTNKTQIEARGFQQAWHQRYPLYSVYCDNVVKEVLTTGQLQTISGRLRRFPIVVDVGPIRNQIINTKIQSTSHDHLMMSIIEGYWPMREMGAYPNIDIHDAWAMLAPKATYREVAKRAIDIMQKPRFGMLSIPCEAKVGPSLGEVEEFKL